MVKQDGGAAVSVRRGGVAIVRRHYSKFGKTTQMSDAALSEEDDDILKVRTFESTPAKVGLNLGGTFPTKVDYEFAKIDVILELPCYPEEKDECYAHVKKWVHSRFKRELIDLELIPAEEGDEEKPKKKIKKIKKALDEKPKKKIEAPEPDDVDD